MIKRRACPSIRPSSVVRFESPAANEYPSISHARGNQIVTYFRWAFIIESMVRQLSLGTCDHVTIPYVFVEKATSCLETTIVDSMYLVPGFRAGWGK
jgi:hypothetical protein